MTYFCLFAIILVEFHEKGKKNMKVCFIGHRTIEKTEELREKVKEYQRLQDGVKRRKIAVCDIRLNQRENKMLQSVHH